MPEMHAFPEYILACVPVHGESKHLICACATIT